MVDKVQIQILFTKETVDGISFTDALYFSPEEYATLSEEQIEALKQERFDKWIYSVNNPPAPNPLEENQSQ
jgi:hypothetical protein